MRGGARLSGGMAGGPLALAVGSRCGEVFRWVVVVGRDQLWRWFGFRGRFRFRWGRI